MNYIIRGIPQSVLLLSVMSVVTPGPHRYRRNDSDYALHLYCSQTDHPMGTPCVQSDQEMVCRGRGTGEWIRQPRRDILTLKILDYPGRCINVSRIQRHFPEINHLELINCTRLFAIEGSFGPTSQIEELVIRGSPMLWELSPDVVERMPKLKILDLRVNGIRHMKEGLLDGPLNLTRVHLSDNQWDCSDGGLDWLAMKTENSKSRRQIVDYDRLVCHQQLYKGKPLRVVMDLRRTMHLNCPKACECTMTYLVTDASGAIIPLITVECTGKQLEVPPPSLPPGTTTLRLEGNKISSIRSIVQNPQYKKLADLFLDNNSISAVKELEGYEWFNSFRILSLRGNKLKQIPVYAFDKAFQVNNDIGQVYLGNNPWRCDCHFIPRFQALLLKYKKVIKDLPDIRCSKSNNKETSFVQISTMHLWNVCGKSGDMEMPLSTVNIINLVLLGLILLVLGKFMYDWRHFRATGNLPWLSTILP